VCGIRNSLGRTPVAEPPFTVYQITVTEKQSRVVSITTFFFLFSFLSRDYWFIVPVYIYIGYIVSMSLALTCLSLGYVLVFSVHDHTGKGIDKLKGSFPFPVSVFKILSLKCIKKTCSMNCWSPCTNCT